MQIPLQVTFEGYDPSEATRAAIEREVERLEKHNRHIIGCRVAVIAPSHKHRHGTGFQVHISLTIPPHENVIVNHAPSNDSRYEHVEAAVREAFASAFGGSRLLGRGLIVALATLSIITGFGISELTARSGIEPAGETVNRILKGDRSPLAF
jgi:ribosome-associated translation inhibitor RaiA